LRFWIFDSGANRRTCANQKSQSEICNHKSKSEILGSPVLSLAGQPPSGLAQELAKMQVVFGVLGGLSDSFQRNDAHAWSFGLTLQRFQISLWKRWEGPECRPHDPTILLSQPVEVVA
jgi:hypothetical protein